MTLLSLHHPCNTRKDSKLKCTSSVSALVDPPWINFVPAHQALSKPIRTFAVVPPLHGGREGESGRETQLSLA